MFDPRLEIIRDKTILFIEKSKIVREIIGSMFLRYCKNVLIAEDGSGALEMFMLHRPDIAVVDMAINEPDGLMFIDSIKKIDADMPIVVIVDFYEDVIRKEIIADAIIVKPIDKNKLFDSILGIFESKS